MNPLKLVNPLTMITGAVGLTGTAVGVVESVVGATARTARSGLLRLTTLEHSGLDDDQGHPEREPTNLPVEPRIPDEPPIHVVGEALAAEAARRDGQSLEGAGFAHEPTAVFRAEKHGGHSCSEQRGREIEDEAAAALEGDREDNDEAEEHLTKPLLEPGAVKALVAETEMLSRAADPNKG
jgi:hypothetical protein